jgi:hypothetical protein
LSVLGETAYSVIIVPRSFQEGKGDYHATVTRLTDGAELIFISNWKWRIEAKTRRRYIEKAFARYDKEQLKEGKTRKFEV